MAHDWQGEHPPQRRERPRLYTTITGDGGGVKSRADAEEVNIEVRYNRDGRGATSARFLVRFPLTAERPSIEISLEDADEIIGDDV